MKAEVSVRRGCVLCERSNGGVGAGGGETEESTEKVRKKRG